MGLAVVLVDGTGDLDGFPNLWVEAGLAGVDEDCLGCLCGCGVARARGLDGETVEGLLALPHGGDNTLGGDVLALEWGLRAGALDLRDGDGRARLVRIWGRIWIRCWGGRLTPGRRWRRGARAEVNGVVVGVRAGCVALCGGRVAQAGGGSAFAYRRLTVPHHVNLSPRGVVQLDRALGTGHAETALGIRGRQRLTGATATFLDKVVAASRDGTVKRGLSAGAALGGEVLHGPAGEIDGRVRRVVELDEVVGEGGALVAAATIDLGDDGGGTIHRGSGLRDNHAGGDQRGDGERANSLEMHETILELGEMSDCASRSTCWVASAIPES